MTAADQTSDVHIRPMRPQDVTALHELWEAAGLPIKPAGRDAEPALLHQLEQFPNTYLVAEQGGQLIGVILGTHDHRKGWINRLAIHPDHRRRGLALRLIEACEQALGARGIEIIAAFVERGNAPSETLFRRAGYVTDVPVHYFRKRAHHDV